MFFFFFLYVGPYIFGGAYAKPTSCLRAQGFCLRERTCENLRLREPTRVSFGLNLPTRPQCEQHLDMFRRMLLGMWSSY